MPEPTTLDAALRPRLERVQQAGLWRQTRVLDGPQRPEIQIAGRKLIAFCSNDYLGLAADPRLAEAMHQALRRHGCGSGAAHLVNGHTRAHAELEEQLAEFTGRERALLFSTGYMANLAVVQTVLGRHDWAMQDRLNHASLLDAVRLAGCHSQRYAHQDVPDLERRLRQRPHPRPTLILTDGVFSMDGDIAPLPALAATAQAHDAWLMVDDAHGLGVLGPQGRGTCAHYAMTATQVPVLMGTLGKALGSAGAFVAGSATLIEALIQFARSYRYTTAMPAALAAAAQTALAIARDESWRREHLACLLQRLRQGLDTLGLGLPPEATTPIQPVVLGATTTATQVARQLLERGFLVPAIRPPTVPQGQARLRITLSATHNLAQVDSLVEALSGILYRASNHPSPRK